MADSPGTTGRGRSPQPLREAAMAHAPAAAGALTVGTLLLWPADRLPTAPTWLPAGLPAWLSSWIGLYGDKVVHAGLFFVLSALFVRSARRFAGLERPVLAAAAAATAYGALLEIAQGLAVGRSTSAADALANGLGALAFAILSSFDRPLRTARAPGVT